MGDDNDGRPTTAVTESDDVTGLGALDGRDESIGEQEGLEEAEDQVGYDEREGNDTEEGPQKEGEKEAASSDPATTSTPPSSSSPPAPSLHPTSVFTGDDNDGRPTTAVTESDGVTGLGALDGVDESIGEQEGLEEAEDQGGYDKGEGDGTEEEPKKEGEKEAASSDPATTAMPSSSSSPPTPSLHPTSRFTGDVDGGRPTIAVAESDDVIVGGASGGGVDESIEEHEGLEEAADQGGFDEREGRGTEGEPENEGEKGAASSGPATTSTPPSSSSPPAPSPPPTSGNMGNDNDGRPTTAVTDRDDGIAEMSSDGGDEERAEGQEGLEEAAAQGEHDEGGSDGADGEAENGEEKREDCGVPYVALSSGGSAFDQGGPSTELVGNAAHRQQQQQQQQLLRLRLQRMDAGWLARRHASRLVASCQSMQHIAAKGEGVHDPAMHAVLRALAAAREAQAAVAEAASLLMVRTCGA